jgi:hypothetical protein
MSNGVTKLTTTLSKLNTVPGSSATSSTRLGSDRIIDRAEPCFITKVSAYTLQQAHVTNAITGRCNKNVDDTAVVVCSYPASDPFAQTSPSFSGKIP